MLKNEQEVKEISQLKVAKKRMEEIKKELMKLKEQIRKEEEEPKTRKEALEKMEKALYRTITWEMRKKLNIYIGKQYGLYPMIEVPDKGKKLNRTQIYEIAHYLNKHFNKIVQPKFNSILTINRISDSIIISYNVIEKSNNLLYKTKIIKN